MKPLVIGLLSDLLFRSKIKEACYKADIDVVFCRSEDSFKGALLREGKKVVFVDIEAGLIEPARIAEMVTNAGVHRVIGYLPHVEVSLRNVAIEAGIEEIYPRSKFVEKLTELCSQ